MVHGEKKLAIGVDIGGTNIKLGLVASNGEVMDDVSLPVRRNKDLSANIHHICEAVHQFIGKHDLQQEVEGIGVSCPGVLDLENGVVKYAINLNWSHLNLVEILQGYTQLPVCLEYDAVAGATGEKIYGAAKSLDHFMYICIGTGVGASLYTNDNFYSFENGPAINLGHTTVVHDGEWCLCGNRGCLEKYVSAPAVFNRYVMGQGVRNADGQLPYMNANLVYQAALSGDLNARSILQEAGELLGISMINSLNLYGINTIVIGGGLSQAQSFFLETARSVVAERFKNHSNSEVSIKQAHFPTKSGLLGGAAKVFNTGGRVR